jgi:hypothetical protein
VRSGAKSLHPAWIAGVEERGWDLFVCPYETVPFVSEPRRGVIVGEPIAGQKWTGLRERLRRWRGWRDYDHVMFAEDDLLAGPSVWSSFFDFCRERGAVLAQPALTQDSHYSHLMTLANRHFIWRATTFVEVMAPTVTPDALCELLPTLDHTPTGFGWGMEAAWSKLLGYAGIYIADALTIRHTRPVGINRHGAMRRRLREEEAGFLRHFGAAHVRLTLGGEDRVHGRITRDDAVFPQRLLLGYGDLGARGAPAFNRFLDDHFVTGPLRYARMTGHRVGRLPARAAPAPAGTPEAGAPRREEVAG